MPGRSSTVSRCNPGHRVRFRFRHVDVPRISMTREQRGRHRDLITEKRVERNGEVIVERPDDKDRLDPELLRQTHLEQVTANLKFRPLADFFASIRYYHIVPQLIRESDRWDSRAGDPFGGDFIEQILRTPARQQRARLSRIERALTAAVPQLKELTVERDPITGVAHLKGRYTHWRPHGAFQTEGDFSDGTLRLIGFLWALQDGDGPLLLEEPELSLHPEVVRQIPQLIGRVQPRPGSSAREGPAYAARLQEFATLHWSIDAASQVSNSLAGCLSALRSLR